MLIENTEARIYHLPSGERLLPGINEIPPEAWLKDQAHPFVIALLGMGALKAPQVAPAKAVEAEHFDLASCTVGEAERVVKATFARDLLSLWLGVEKRNKVKRAIEAQLDTLAIKPSAE